MSKIFVKKQDCGVKMRERERGKGRECERECREETSMKG